MCTGACLNPIRRAPGDVLSGWQDQLKTKSALCCEGPTGTPRPSLAVYLVVFIRLCRDFGFPGGRADSLACVELGRCPNPRGGYPCDPAPFPFISIFQNGPRCQGFAS